MPTPDPSPSHSGDLRTGTPTIIERDDGSDYSHNSDNEEIHHEQYPEPNKDGQYDPFLVRFEEGDPENPKVRMAGKDGQRALAGLTRINGRTGPLHAIRT